jgi:hypothetical protein
MQAPVLSLAERFGNLVGLASPKAVLEGPHALAVGDAYPVTVLQDNLLVGVEAGQGGEFAIDEGDAFFFGRDLELIDEFTDGGAWGQIKL